MEPDDRTNQLLQCLLQVVGRAAIPLEKVREVVGTKKKQIKAFNLCDGTNSQEQIGRKTGLDKGSLSRTIKRWIENGAVFRIGSGNDYRPLHVYPIPGGAGKSVNRKRRKKKR